MKTFQERLLRAASSLFVVLMMISFLASFYLERVAIVARPVLPNVDAGFVYAVEVKGKIVFMGLVESLLLQWLLPAGLILGLLGAVLWGLADKRSESYS